MIRINPHEYSIGCDVCQTEGFLIPAPCARNATAQRLVKLCEVLKDRGWWIDERDGADVCPMCAGILAALEKKRK